MKIYITIIFIFLFEIVSAQETYFDKTPYIKLNSNEYMYQDISIKDTLNIFYIEKYKRSNEYILFEFYNENSVKLGEYKELIKLGNNYINICLSDLFFIKRGNSYYVKYTEKYGQKGGFKLNYIKLPKPLKVDNYLTSISLNCDKNESSLFTLESIIEGGSPPYKISYIISKDKDQSELLYEPYHKEISDTSLKKKLKIEANEGFFIKVIIIDNCKEIKEDLLFASCRENTIIKININPFQLNENDLDRTQNITSQNKNSD